MITAKEARDLSKSDEHIKKLLQNDFQVFRYSSDIKKGM